MNAMQCLDMMRDDTGYSTSRDDGDLRVLYKCKGDSPASAVPRIFSSYKVTTQTKLEASHIHSQRLIADGECRKLLEIASDIATRHYRRERS